ncbi:TetR/AcrR family transcriptional regulator [Kordiimonas marina]|uniref:TetR/AcrR family transcriptional regulator n=1 Tax=Kordiimonas marina TaxID=2872312 RepID=UPI001FF382AE|nr:TetR family transcriptional regulator [Kordiimonas marina]MCJ9429040.1 TetR family transcriptional regulator [Kordiimonas marina]
MAEPEKKKRQSRKERILDAAEALLARHGFDGVSMRMVAERAKVDLALASYHFGSKQGLFDAVLLRRAEVLNEARQAALEECQANAGPDGPTVEEIIDAFLNPMLAHGYEDDEGWRHYFELIGQVNSSTEWGGQLMTKYFDPLVRRFMDALKKALPDADPANLYWSYHFLSGALTLTFARTGRIDHLSNGAIHSDDMLGAYKRMVPFVAAGFRELCEKK